MCSLKKWVVIFLFLISFYSSAEPGSVGYSITQDTTKGQTLYTELDNQSKVESRTQTIKFSTGLQRNLFRVRGGFNQISRDLEQYTITGETGEESTLTDTFDGKESQVSGGGDLLVGPIIISGDYQSTISDSPLSSRSLTLGLGFSNYDSGTNIKYEYGQLSDNRPQTYITNPETLLGQALPTQIKQKSHQLSADQILSENLKTELILKFNEETVERPANYGFKSQIFTGVTDNLGIALAYEQVKERSNKLPIAGGGPYELRHYQGGVSYEFAYNFFITTLYSTTLEIEKSRGSFLPEQKIGTDTYSLSIEGRMKRIIPTLLASYQVSNTQREGLLLSGGITWEL